MNPAASAGSTFTYQGELRQGNVPYDGACDFDFYLFDAAADGAQIGDNVSLLNHPVTAGRFTASLDFGPGAFTGDARWLEVRVRCPAGGSGWTILSPRQPLTAAPYALSLRPGATISGTVDGSGVLNVANDDADGLVVDSAGITGVYVNSADRYGLYVNSAGDGVYVRSVNNNGVYVQSAGDNGVSATTVDSGSYGGRFVNAADSGSGAGLYTRGNSGQAPDIVLGASFGGTFDDDGRIVSDPNYDSSDIRFFTNDNLWIDLDESDTHTGSNFTIRNSDNRTVWSVDENGNITNRGSKSTLVDAGSSGQVQLYDLQSSGNWFEDFGTASLVDGQATVAIDPTFAATVNLAQSYHVYLTPLGDCALYVAGKSSTSFDVRALGGATCSIDFDYRIVAKRTGYEGLRLEPAEPAREEE